MKSFVLAVMAVNILWHGLATYHFLFFPARTIARYTTPRPVNEIAAELMRFLGALNGAIVALAVLCLMYPPSWTVYVFYALANFSQFAIDLWVHQKGLTNARFLRDITLGDGVVTVLNAFAAIA